jgi:tetratricopeptide (TPR) repeat protein
MTEGLAHAEALMIEGQNDEALSVLLGIAEDAEEYVDRNCPTTDEVQWFSFPTIFERLAYRRVEKDPRELRDVGEPMDRLYGDLALAAVHTGDYDIATNALKQAVRWNPMGCEMRLNLADLFRVNGDINEYLALTYSVFERASDARHLARAFANFSEYFLVQQKPRAAAAALRAGRRLGVKERALDQSLDQAAGTTHDPDLVGDDEARDLLAQEGLPDGANAEIAICLLMCATDAAQAGQQDVATNLTVRARDLVGEEASMALLRLIRQSDADLAADQGAAPAQGAPGEKDAADGADGTAGGDADGR